MGSKKALLDNGLGAALLREAENATRFVDLFAGSGAVGTYIAERVSIPVLAVDLQQYAVDLSASVVARTEPITASTICALWLEAANTARSSNPGWSETEGLVPPRVTATTVHRARRISQEGLPGSILRAYGGHYFSPRQAITLDHMLACAPKTGSLGAVCSAVVIRTGSRCAAAPGHTAQPFQPTPGAMRYIESAWAKDPLVVARAVLEDLAPRHALAEGVAVRADALSIAGTLRASDLVVVDPPYSAVQYSRFYHVLEALARGAVQEVRGVGRYARIAERPQSDFSLKTKSREACRALLSALANAQCRVVFTFPSGRCSNGLSGSEVVAMASAHFQVDVVAVNGRFSTLGGNGTGRPSRHPSEELILTMAPRRRQTHIRASVAR